MGSINLSLQAQAEAAFIEGCNRLAEKYKVKVEIKMDEYLVDFKSEDKEEIVKIAMELDDLYKTVRKRFYGGA